MKYIVQIEPTKYSLSIKEKIAISINVINTGKTERTNVTNNIIEFANQFHSYQKISRYF